MKRGFTLVEIIIVVVILGVFVAVALPRYQKTIEQQREAAAKVNLEMMYSAQQVYRSRAGVYYGGGPLSNINTNLGLSIASSTEFAYSCTVLGSSFTCAADRTGGYTINVGSNSGYFPPCCKIGVCPTLLNCP